VFHSYLKASLDRQGIWLLKEINFRPQTPNSYQKRTLPWEKMNSFIFLFSVSCSMSWTGWRSVHLCTYPQELAPSLIREWIQDTRTQWPMVPVSGPQKSCDWVDLLRICGELVGTRAWSGFIVEGPDHVTRMTWRRKSNRWSSVIEVTDFWPSLKSFTDHCLGLQSWKLSAGFECDHIWSYKLQELPRPGSMCPRLACAEEALGNLSRWRFWFCRSEWNRILHF
jgi:hypothetical protein